MLAKCTIIIAMLLSVGSTLGHRRRLFAVNKLMLGVSVHYHNHINYTNYNFLNKQFNLDSKTTKNIKWSIYELLS